MNNNDKQYRLISENFKKYMATGISPKKILNESTDAREIATDLMAEWEDSEGMYDTWARSRDRNQETHLIDVWKEKLEYDYQHAIPISNEVLQYLEAENYHTLIDVLENTGLSDHLHH